MHERMRPHLENLFDTEPRAGFVVKRTEAFRERSASAEYVPGTKDGSRPGVFYVPIPDVTAYNKYADESLVRNVDGVVVGRGGAVVDVQRGRHLEDPHVVGHLRGSGEW